MQHIPLFNHLQKMMFKLCISLRPVIKSICILQVWGLGLDVQFQNMDTVVKHNYFVTYINCEMMIMHVK